MNIRATPDRKHRATRVLAGLVLALAVVGIAAAAPQEITDLDITRAVEDALWADEATDANAIDVECRDGIVTLTGSIDNLLAGDRAVRIAESTLGVRAVVNRLEVEPGVERSDAELEQAVAGALLADPATDSYEVAVAVDEGVVALSGSVQSWQEKQICGTVARSVRGVKGVVNQLDVERAADRLDREIEAEVEARLAHDVRVDDYLIVVEVEDGVVSLTGTVGSLAEKNIAIGDAWVAGVSDVDGEGLEIEWWARDRMRRASPFLERSDEEIREAVKDAFLYDPRVMSFKPEVSVSDGAVTLSGVVDNLAAKRAAEQDARNVVGVWRVTNHIKVRPVTPTLDAELESEVARALREDPFLNRSEIDIDVNLSLVTLSGEVDTMLEKRRAERVAEGVNGVVAVVNNLDYQAEWTWRSDREIRADIEEELLWSPFVDAGDIEVSVTDGVATLTGTVATWAEADAAAQNAYDGGALEVRNRLLVEHQVYGPYPSYRDALMPFLVP